MISELGTDGWIRVRWDTGSVNSYRMSKEDKYDLSLAPSELIPQTKEVETKEAPSDTKLTVGMAKTLTAQDIPSALIFQSSVCLLRCLVVCVGISSDQLHHRTTSSLSSMLHHIVHCAKKKGTYVHYCMCVQREY